MQRQFVIGNVLAHKQRLKHWPLPDYVEVSVSESGLEDHRHSGRDVRCSIDERYGRIRIEVVDVDVRIPVGRLDRRGVDVEYDPQRLLLERSTFHGENRVVPFPCGVDTSKLHLMP